MSNTILVKCCLSNVYTILSPKPRRSDGPKHDFYFDEGGIIIETNYYSPHEYEVARKRLIREFGEFEYEVNYYLADVYNSDSPKIWKKWWTNQMLSDDDGDDGPWKSPRKLSVRYLWPYPASGFDDDDYAVTI